MLPVDTPRHLERLRAFHRRAEAILGLPDSVLLEPVARVSAWSPIQQLFHVLLANELAYRNIRLIAEGTSPWLVAGGGPNLLGFLVLRAEHIPRGRAKAPRIVVPPKRPNPAIVRDTLRSNAAALESIAAGREGVLRAGRRDGGTGIPHQDLGNLGPALWIAFAAIHGHHHLELCEEILARAPVPDHGGAAPA